MIGPIMHTPFLVTLPLCYHWLGTTDSGTDRFMYMFIAYTSIVTSISMMLDANITHQWASGREVGEYARGKRGGVPHRIFLPLPSVVMAVAAHYFCPAPEH